METLKKEIMDWYTGEYKYFEEAFDAVMKTTSKNREVVEHSICVDKEKLFGDIVNAIEYLETLKAKGYPYIEERWRGYESNYFVAFNNETENDAEYCCRLGREVSVYSEKIRKREEQKARKKKRIKELESELQKLKKEI